LFLLVFRVTAILPESGHSRILIVSDFSKTYMKYIFIFKKLPKYIIISAIFKLIFIFLGNTLSYYNINTIYLYLLIAILLSYSFFTCKNKFEYITIIATLVAFWYILGNVFIINGLQDLSFFKSFVFNYYGELSFDLSNCFLDNQNKNVINDNFDCLSEEKKLIETKVYDTSGNVEKLKVENFYNPLYLENYSEETFETNLDFSYETLDRQLERSHNIKYIKLQAKLLKINDLRSSSVLSETEALNNLIDNLSKYKDEALKFKCIIEDIDMKTEKFYPAEAKVLFTEYKDQLIPVLIANINECLDNLISPQNVPLPEQTEEELISLNEPLPEQTEEKTSLEAEDFMADAIKNLDMFSEKDSLEAEDFMADAIKNLGMFSEKD
jgi:hypothetical protein